MYLDPPVLSVSSFARCFMHDAETKSADICSDSCQPSAVLVFLWVPAYSLEISEFELYVILLVSYPKCSFANFI